MNERLIAAARAVVQRWHSTGRNAAQTAELIKELWDAADALAAQPAAQPVAYPVLPEPDLHALLSDCRGYLQSYAHAAIDADRASAAQPARAGGDALQQAVSDYLEAQDALDNWELQSINREPHDRVMRRRNDARRGLDAALAAAPQPAPASTVESVLHAFESKERGIPQAHIAAQLVSELRFALEAAAPAQAPQPAAAEPAGGVADELAKHLRAAHAFIENTDAFGRTASRGILDCGGCIWNVDESKAALSRHEAGAIAAQVEQPAASTVPAGYVSAEQLAAHQDPEGDEPFGRYLPVRKTPAGKFTQPIYTAAPAAVEREASDRDRADAAMWRQHAGKLDALVTYCPTCCEGFASKKELTRDEVIFECGRTAGRAPLRNALVLAVDHIDMAALRISHCKDAAVIDAALGIGSSKEGGDER